MLHKQTKGVDIEIGPKVVRFKGREYSSSAVCHAKATSQLDADCKQSLGFVLNGYYLLDALNACEAGPITMVLGIDAMDPVMLDADDGFKHIVMPMRS